VSAPERVREAAGPTDATVAVTDEPTARRRVPDAVWSLLLAVAIVAILEVATRTGMLSQDIFPMPSAIAESIVDGFGSGRYPVALASTLWTTVVGFLLAVVLALAAAGLVVSVPRFERIVMPFIVAFQTLPKVALAPIILLIFGFGATTKVVIVAVVSFFPILVNAVQGLRIRQRDTLEVFVSLGATRWQTFRRLRVPGSAPYLFAGFQIGLVFAVIGAVTAELVGAPEGLGAVMLQEMARFNIQGMWAVLVILMVVGVLLRTVVVLTERRVAFWAREQSDEVGASGGV
jgi:NitT/TauT family transport system permease protein